MRRLILTAAVLVLGACGNNDQKDQTQNIDENLSAENIVANDITAIDAVTASDANMAADVDVNFTNELAVDNSSGNASAPASTRRPASRPAKPRPQPQAEPATNAE